ncbi:MAG: hypothetical protein IKJ98_08635 [Bacteroidales bacterium]|nr:hypothetical protein [Bacteroidales bacterium]
MNLYKSFRIIALTLIGAMLLLSSCKKGTNEGTLTFAVEYDEQEKAEREIIGLLPETLKYYYKNGSSTAEISAFGMFRAAYISNVQEKTNSVLFYFMPKKYTCKAKFGERMIGFDPLPGLILTPTDEEKEILGFTAHKVHVSFEDKSKEEYDIWYTNDIKIHDPNWPNPYKEIDGVLLDYRVALKGISMHISLSGISENAVDSSKFYVPKDFVNVEVDTMNAIFDEYLKMEF